MLPLFFLRREKYAAGFWQRLGHIPVLRQNGMPVIWIHCVSVGETNAAVPLIKALNAEFPDFRIVISTTTKTGQEIAQKLFSDTANLIFYFPFDWKFTVRRVLKKIKPNIILLMETEIWFNFIREAKTTGTQVFIVNGRISEKSAARYLKIRNIMGRVLRFVDLALMQTTADAQRLLRLGINPKKVRVTGNVKFDQPPIAKENVFLSYFLERFEITPENPLIVAASTHAPEEEWILTAFKKIHKNSAGLLPRLLIAPRHPERFAEVAELVAKSGLKLVKRSSPLSLEDVSADVILLDSIGELRQIFALAEIVFVGGSLIRHGGQNILEPAIARKAIITGHHTMNFAEIIKKFEKNEALIRLPELKENEIPLKLAGVFQELLQNEEKRRKIADNAARMLEENRGATDRTLNFLRPVLQVQLSKNFVSGNPANPVKSEITV